MTDIEKARVKRTAETIARAEELRRYLDTAEFLVNSGPDSVQAYEPSPPLASAIDDGEPECVRPSDRSKVFTRGKVNLMVSDPFPRPILEGVQVVVCEGIIIHATHGAFFLSHLIGEPIS